MQMKTPSFTAPQAVSFPSLAGGLNLRDLGYLVDGDESPNMKNLVWRNGLLQSRDGQYKVAQAKPISPLSTNPCYAAYDSLFHEYAFFHVGNTIQCLDMSPPPTAAFDANNPLQCEVVYEGVPRKKGSFFRYQDKLYYKTTGKAGFLQIEVDENGEEQQTYDGGFKWKASTAASRFDLYMCDSIYAESMSLVTSAKTHAQLDGKVIALRHRDSGVLLTPFAFSYPMSSAYVVPEGTMTLPNLITAQAPDALFEVALVEDPDDSSETVLHLLTKIYLRQPPGMLCCEDLGTDDEGLLVPSSRWDDPGIESYWDLTFSNGSYQLKSWWEPTTAITFDFPYAVTSQFQCRTMESVATDQENTPVIVINADPSTGSGTMYQPENRLSYNKTVWYNAVAGVSVYHLPVKNIASIEYVEVNGQELPRQTDLGVTNYTINKKAGTVTFVTAPDPGDPPANNTVRITYKKANKDARLALFNCRYATVASGGDAAQFIVLGGCTNQPDAIFWNGNDDLAIQPWYFPMPCYNLVGTAGDEVTGFGRQYNDTLVFSEHTVGKLSYSIQNIDGRETPAFGYLSVNAKIGCDLPWTIQQVENNVVFCNSYSGAHIVLSSSSAYENNVQELSQKIKEDGSAVGTDIKGLLRDIRESSTPVVSFDDDERYWLCANGKVYVWDYGISTYADPSWFYWTDIAPAALLRDDSHGIYHMKADGTLARFDRTNSNLSDFGSAISKLYQFPTLHFGSYDRLKDVLYLLLSVRSDVNSTVAIRYDTDYETRYDLTPIVTTAPTGTSVAQSRRFVMVAKRKPGCRHVRQFGLTLSNNTAGEDLALVSAQVFYRFTGKER